MTSPNLPDNRPSPDIPEDLVAYALIGGPWLARLIFAARLLVFSARLLAPWQYGGYLEIRRKIKFEVEITA